MPTAPSELPPPRSARNAHRWLAVAGVLGTLLAINFLGGRFIEGFSVGNGLLILLGFVWMGMIVAEIALLSGGVVFAKRPFWQRLAWHWLAAIALFAAWYAAISSGETYSRQDIVSSFLSMSVMGLAMQTPLWLLRLFFRWRIADPHAATFAEELRPLSIRDLLIATAVVGAYAAAARGAAAEDNAAHWWIWGGAFLYYAIASALSILPLLYWLLRLKSVRWGAAFSVLYTLVWAGGSFALLYALSPPALGQYGLGPILVWPCLIVGYGFGLTAMFLLIRACGYRLQWGKE